MKVFAVFYKPDCEELILSLHTTIAGAVDAADARFVDQDTKDYYDVRIGQMEVHE
jgi:hypothetical protein